MRIAYHVIETEITLSATVNIIPRLKATCAKALITKGTCVFSVSNTCQQINWPFFGTAVVLMLATSDPLPTSLTPRHATMSPATEGARNSFFNSALPKRERAGVAMSVVCVCVCVCVHVCACVCVHVCVCACTHYTCMFTYRYM